MIGTICLVGDSFGTKRIHNNVVEVPEDATWPQQVQRVFPTGQVQIDFRPFRRIVECPSLLPTHTDCQLAIVQAGLVDCYPRPLPHGPSRSNHLFWKVLRRCIRPLRREWVNYVYRTTWSSRFDVVHAIEALLTQHPTRWTGLVTAAPLRKEHALFTPGAQEAIFEFNDLLRETASGHSRAFVIDLHTALLAEGHQRLLSPTDSHLNQAGNNWMARQVLTQISQRLSSQTGTIEKAAA